MKTALAIFYGWICLLLFSAAGGSSGAAQPASPSAPPAEVLTSAAQLRALSLAEMEREIPVKLRAVVTGLTALPIVFIQDRTGGTFIAELRPDYSPKVTPGDVIEVEGVTHVGWFMAGIKSAKFQVIGRNELPAPVPVTFDDLLSTRRHYERVEIGGIVRSVTPMPGGEGSIVTIAMGPRKLDIRLVAPGASDLPPLVNARVRVAGLAAGYINDRRQIVAPQLFVSRLEDLHVEEPPLADPFEAPSNTIDGLLNFNPAGVSVHRVRIRGVVTHQQSGKAIFLTDGERGLLAQTAQDTAVQPGDVVEVIGFPAMHRFSAILEDAEFRVIGRDWVPAPLPMMMAEALQRANDGTLITIEAQVLELLETPAESILVLRAEDTVFRARLARTALPLRAGSMVRLTGIGRVEESNFPEITFRTSPRTIELLLRSADDIVVLAEPSWWTAPRLAIASGGLLGVALAALVWISLLRRRVAQQAGVIGEKMQREAALEERHRMAREIHDTLAQSFSGLGFQLDALEAQLGPGADAARRQLATARKIVRHGQEDFRRSLLNLRAQELERGSLAEALPELARQITAGTGIELRCEVRGPQRGLPEALESNLLRIGQECLTNAVRHARPKRIDLALTREPGEVQLRIADDGAGLDLQQLNGNSNGHYGWRGIRERAQQISARIDVHSEPDRGTVIVCTVPI